MKILWPDLEQDFFRQRYFLEDPRPLPERPVEKTQEGVSLSITQHGLENLQNPRVPVCDLGAN